MTRRIRAVAWIGLLIWAPASQAADQLKVWIRAFIPNTHPGNPTYIKPVPGVSGAWMIPAPSLGPLDALAQLVSSVPLDGDTCFATDDRSFTSSAVASARLTTAFSLTVSGNPPGVTPLSDHDSINFPGVSKAYKCSSGAVILQKPGKMQLNAVGGPHVAGTQTQIIIDAAASLPFISGSAWVHYSADMTFDSATKALKYTVTIGRFPAFEAYAQLNSGPVKKLFSENPVGASVWSLVDLGSGLARRVEDGQVQF
jgi:hypothetical protein